MILDKIRNNIRALSLEDPNVPLGAWGALANAMIAWGGGATDSGVAVSERSALNLSAFWRAINLIANSIATLPLHVYEESDTDLSKKLARNTTVYTLLRHTPNPYMTPSVFKFAVQAQALAWGAGYAAIERDAVGRPKALWPLLSSHVKPIRKNGVMFFENRATANGEPAYLKAADVLYLPFATLDGVEPLSPLGAYRQAVGLGIAAESFGSKFFGNGGHPSGILSADKTLTKEQKKDLRDSWKDAHGGSNALKTAVLDGGLKWTQITVNPEDAQFLQTRKFQVSEIARVFGIPPHMLADLERSTNNNIEQQSLEYLRDCIQPWGTRWTEEVDAKLLSGNQVAAFDYDELLRTDFATMQEGYATGRQWGWFSANDVLRRQGKNPIGPQGDIYMVPLNMVDARSIDQAKPDPAGAENNTSNTSNTSDTARNAARDRAIKANRHIFRDAVGRILTREKRSEQHVTRAILPALTCLAESLSATELSPEFGEFLSNYAGGMAHRAAAWSATDVDTITETELTRATAAVLDRVLKETKQ